jgi:hypothetical protein
MKRVSVVKDSRAGNWLAARITFIPPSAAFSRCSSALSRCPSCAKVSARSSEARAGLPFVWM